MPNETLEQTTSQNNTDGAGKNEQTQDSTSEQSLIGGAADGAKTETEKPPEDGKGDSLIGDEGKTDEAGKKETPETYEFKAPEGLELDPALVEAFSPMAKEMGLSQEQAQKLVDFHISQVQKIDTEMAATLEKQVTGWKDEAKKDPEIQQKLSLCRKFVDHTGDQGLKDLIYGSWVGSHPAVINALAKAGKLISEDTMPPGAGGSKPEKSRAQKLYPNMK